MTPVQEITGSIPKEPNIIALAAKVTSIDQHWSVRLFSTSITVTIGRRNVNESSKCNQLVVLSLIHEE